MSDSAEVGAGPPRSGRHRLICGGRTATTSGGQAEPPRPAQPASEQRRRRGQRPDIVADDALAPIDQARVQRSRQAAATEAAAPRRARAEKAGREVALSRRLEQTA
ncbi:hypothetical protein ACIBBE_49085 [Streptomyces sp. NPDC051644]|uniref:hypothetical protein n=1 Tax=Streptomyces sp. NPDC051644 TaxID=3365666 RepID=UPI0037AF85FC